MMSVDVSLMTDGADAPADASVNAHVEGASDALVDVFVYGTLRRGEINDIARAAERHRLAAPQLIGTASIPGQLFDLGRYPGLVWQEARDADTAATSLAESGATPAARRPSWVVGDVYRVVPALLPVLDDIEGIRADAREEFYRATCHVRVGSTAHRCLFYPIDPDAAVNRRIIEGGDWIAYRVARDH